MPQLGSRKSRRGCKRCKQRRVKCDEQVPCGSCLKRNDECSLLEVTPSEGSETAEDSILSTSTEDWIVDLELMYHYITTLYQLGARKDVVQLWRNYIPQQAFKHHFLMHGLLALAALHLAHLRPENSFKYLRSCDKHQGIALQEFRKILSASSIDPGHADALFALSATLSVLSMARSCALSENATINMDAIAELFVLTKGIQNVIHLAYEHINQGPLAAMLETGEDYPKDNEIHLPLCISSRFEAIQHMLMTYELDPEALGHCQNALGELEKIYKNISYISTRANIELGDVSRWQVSISPGYVRLIQARMPPALIILAYYAAAITAVRTAWYTQSWAEYTLRGISQALDGKMQEWIEWPMQQVQERMSVLGVRSPSLRYSDTGSNSYSPPISILTIALI